ncbi:T9SS C-terminal target domain-containing protein [Aureibaculum marinum]|uniref:T9SS C-terminal target domain-containing protein n=1 Tax=Aureibaculum marinum TaxID=2487930 RepID=A0A3N4NVS5_9FLAO|nr:type IX secretion system sortase PorU [Aureibaculum marinum]RPD99925.1 T9SS C-terminal target domain-containing protein [Aureibaculum marinum]
MKSSFLKKHIVNFIHLLYIVPFFVYAQNIESNTTFNKKFVSTLKNSVLSKGTWYKFAIDTTGIFKIDKQFLQNLGLNVNDINPKNIRIFGNGGQLLPQKNSDFRYDGLQENAIYVKGEDDNSFDNNDYILFYGKGPHSWNITPSQPTQSRHINNIYSDRAYYFLTVDNGLGKRISNANEISATPTQTITNFNDYDFIENDNINLFANGQQWFGKDLSFENSTTKIFKFENLDTSQPISIRVRAVTISSTSSSLDIKVNGQQLMTLNFPSIPSTTGNLTLAIPREDIQSIIVNTTPIEVQITYNNNGNPSAKAYLDYVEIIGQKKLIATGKQFSFRNYSTSTSASLFNYEIENANNIYQVWNVTDYLNPQILTNQSTTGQFTFKSFGGTLQEYIVLNENDFYSPEIINQSNISNQNLHNLKDIDYVIITKDFLISEAERLAAYHREYSNLTVEVIDVNHIYNEFGSGSPDLTAIRDFIRHLYVNASSEDTRIKFVCLFGDASYDFKDRINDNNNIIPSFQSFESFDLARSYVTDDYYGMMDDDEGELSNSDKQDVATGRFPISTIAEAKITVDKTLNYYSTTSFGDWRNRITLVADDPDVASEFVLQETVEKLADTIKERRPIYNLTKIYADSYVQETSAGGERYPDVNEAINNAVETGSLIVNYFGHGGEDGWANERILEVTEINAWNNSDKLPLFITVTCEFSKFDNPLRPTAGEAVFLNPNGGAISLITTTREIFINVGQQYNEILTKKLFGFNGEDYTIAEAMMAMKNDPSAPNSSQRLFVFYLGDPAMKLARSKPNVKLTKINGKDITSATDTLKALSKISLEGIVTDELGNSLTDFNGELSATIFDKSIERTTLDNNNFGNKLTFDAIESKIFRGRASVKNGIFNFNFVVPKDIRIAYGKAKISFYADNKIIDKGGVNQEIIIGGIDENAPEDNEGPTIQLFMDDESFVDGGNTSESPHLIAILEDSSGINTSITAVDHDIVAILDGNQANPYILNDFYETELDDFTKGKVKFPFRNLEPGLHTINFKVWDTYNNSSEATLNFVVVDNGDLVLSNVLNYPNPFINYTEFWFNHNKPNEPLEVQIQIFTVSGKLIKTINQNVQSDNLSRSISWNGLDDFGNKIGKGVYIYKLNVKSTLTNTKTEKFEKLVILQ